VSDITVLRLWVQTWSGVLSEFPATFSVVDHNHFEPALGRAAVRADPILRHVFPPSAGGKAVLGLFLWQNLPHIVKLNRKLRFED
jgi:hypothetical protein